MTEEPERGSAERTLLWTSIILEHEGTQTPVEMKLGLERESPDGSSASILFEGADVAPVQADGPTPLDALAAVVQCAEARLNELRTEGWRILHHEHGYGVQPFDIALADHYQFVLERFGPQPDAQIVSGPTPSDCGNAVFVVRVDDRLVSVYMSSDGIGWREGDTKDFNIAARLVSAYVDERPTEQLEWYKQAARLRRAASNPRPYDFPRLPHITVSGEPIAGQYFVELVIAGAGVPHRILFSHRGGISDECEHWPSLAEPDRNAAFATALDYAFANPEKMTAAGLDMALFIELYS